MLGEEKDPKWMQNLWRPAMGWMYMLICLLDMAIFPVAWSLLQAMMHVPITQWNPLTLQGAGLFHIAMGAVLGIAAFGRTQEKLAGTAANPTATVSTQNVNMSGNTQGGYGSNTGGTYNNNMGGGFNSAPAFNNTPAYGNSPAFGTSPSFNSSPAFGSQSAPSFGSSPAFGAPAHAFGTTGASCPSTGRPLGPSQSFPAL
jgi:hypothetical protein